MAGLPRNLEYEVAASLLLFQLKQSKKEVKKAKSGK